MEKLKEELPVSRVYLFGSFARDEVHEGSDIDLLIVGDFPERVFTRIERVLELTDLPSEPLVCTSAEFEELVRARNLFILCVLSGGKGAVSYAAPAAIG